MMMLRRAIPILIIFTASLTGCGSSPPVTFYALEPLLEPAGKAGGQIVIGVGPLSFPEYLQRPQIVTLRQAGEVSIAEFDRWAEPVTESFQRTLTMNLGSLIDDAIAIQFPFGGGLVKVHYRVIGQVARFDVDAAGTATLDVTWGIADAEDKALVPATRSVFHSAVSSVSDYRQVVGAMNETLTAFSREIAQQFTAARTR